VEIVIAMATKDVLDRKTSSSKRAALLEVTCTIERMRLNSDPMALRLLVISWD
jgi:hypothetical protein